MRLCKDCWYCWIEKGICCHEKSKKDFITGASIGTVFEMRDANYLGECGVNAKFWRPKQYSPNKNYKFSIECPYCRLIFVYDLYNEDSGKRSCSKCKNNLWLPGYGKNVIDTEKYLLAKWQIEEWENSEGNFK